MDYIKIITALYGLITVIIVMYLLIKLYSVRLHLFDYISGFFKFLSNIFFDAENFPKAVVDTKKFSYVNDTEIELEIELSIKGVIAVINGLDIVPTPEFELF